jgi:putative salt-induced outer membrane protein
MRIRRIWIGGLVLPLVTTVTFAQSEEDDEGLSGQVAFGYLATSGNTESENMNLNFGIAIDRERWHHSLDGQAVRASSNEMTTAEAYSLEWQTRYDFGEHNYVFGLVAWNQDKFSAYDQQLREVVGYGRRFIDRERHMLDGEAGLGFRQADLRDGTSQDKSIARLSLNYEWSISESAAFKQTLAVESGSDNTYTQSATSLSADVWNTLAIVLSYTIKRNSDVPVGTRKKDTFTAISLEYSF